MQNHLFKIYFWLRRFIKNKLCQKETIPLCKNSVTKADHCIAIYFFIRCLWNSHRNKIVFHKLDIHATLGLISINLSMQKLTTSSTKTFYFHNTFSYAPLNKSLVVTHDLLCFIKCDTKSKGRNNWYKKIVLERIFPDFYPFFLKIYTVNSRRCDIVVLFNVGANSSSTVV